MIIIYASQGYDYGDCLCIADPAAGLALSNSTATSGLCQSTCILIVPTLILFLIAVMMLFAIAIPYQYFILRQAEVVINVKHSMKSDDVTFLAILNCQCCLIKKSNSIQ